MEARNTAESDSASQNSLRAEYRSDNRLCELDWKLLPCLKLPRPASYSNKWQRKQKLVVLGRSDVFGIDGGMRAAHAKCLFFGGAERALERSGSRRAPETKIGRADTPQLDPGCARPWIE